MVIVKYYKQVHKGRWHPSFRDWEPNSARLPDYIGKKAYSLAEVFGIIFFIKISLISSLKMFLCIKCLHRFLLFRVFCHLCSTDLYLIYKHKHL